MDRRIVIAISTMETQISRPLSMSDLSARVNLSESRFRHLFKQETRVTPARYLKDLRLSKAEILLRTTFLSVKEIGCRVGLATGSHFVREFKRSYGSTPSSYRNELRSGRSSPESKKGMD
jgi:transcriptional regulator GlxA family with amidase domain